MVGRRIDRLARRRAGGLDRRQLAGGVAAALLAGSLLAAPADAGCKKFGKKCDKNGDCCDGASCKGGKCTCKNSHEECGGKCFKLDGDEEHCGACDIACGASEACCDGNCADVSGDPANCGACGNVCAEGEVCTAGVCGPPSGTCPPDAAACSFGGTVVACGANCACSPTTEDTVLCGDLWTEGAVCGQCQTSSDCVEFGFGVGSLCVKTGLLCCPDGLNFCRRPCPA